MRSRYERIGIDDRKGKHRDLMLYTRWYFWRRMEFFQKRLKTRKFMFLDRLANLLAAKIALGVIDLVAKTEKETMEMKRGLVWFARLFTVPVYCEKHVFDSGVSMFYELVAISKNFDPETYRKRVYQDYSQKYRSQVFLASLAGVATAGEMPEKFLLTVSVMVALMVYGMGALGAKLGALMLSL